MPARTKEIINFYKSRHWQAIREIAIEENMTANGGVIICDICGKPIVGRNQCHVHHIKEITPYNVTDPNVTLNIDNLQVIHHECHNEVHNRFNGRNNDKVYLVYGPPCAGKEEFVTHRASANDLILSVDRLFKCFTVNPMYDEPAVFNTAVFETRKMILSLIKTRAGKWQNVWIIDAMPSKARRQEMVRVYQAEPILVFKEKEECKQRREEEQRPEEIDKYIDRWFEEYTE